MNITVKDFIIRRAKAEDAKGIHEVILAAFKEFQSDYSREGFADTVMSEDVALDRINKMRVYVAIDESGSIIGTIGWQKVSNEEGHIRGMAVHPDRQGKNSPAIELFQTVENDARSQDCSFLTLDTTEILKRAQSFYRKCGFEATGKTGDFFGSTIYEFLKKI